MSPKPARSPHHVTHVEEGHGVHTLGEMEPGQVFVREGAPHMRVSLDSSTRTAVAWHHSVGNGLYVINLLTGSVWPLSATSQVYPATDVKLTFKSNRRDAL